MPLGLTHDQLQQIMSTARTIPRGLRSEHIQSCFHLLKMARPPETLPSSFSVSSIAPFLVGLISLSRESVVFLLAFSVPLV